MLNKKLQTLCKLLRKVRRQAKGNLVLEAQNVGTGSKLGVPDESIVVSATSSEGTGAKPGVPDEDKDITKEKVILDWGDEQDSEFSDDDNDDVEKDDKDGDANDEGDDHVSDTQDADDEDVKIEYDKDEIYEYKIRVHKDDDVEIKDDEVEESDKGEEKVTDAAKEEAKKTSEAKDDTKKTELPPSSLSLSVSSGFGDELLRLSSDSSLVSTVKDSIDADKIPVSVIPETTNLPPIPEIVTETPVSTTVSSPQVTPIFSSVHQTPTPIPTPPIITDALTIIIVFHESDAISVVELRVAKLKKEVSELKTHLPELTKKPTPTAKQESEKGPSDILMIKGQVRGSKEPTRFLNQGLHDKAALEESDLKRSLQYMHANKSFLQGVADTVKDHKIKHDDNEDDDDENPPAGPNYGKKTKRRRTKEYESSKKPSTIKETPKGKASTKGSKTGKSASAKEPVKEPINEVVMDDAGDDVAHDDNPPQDTSEPKTRKTLNLEWFKQPPRPHTPDS
ncbi:hypothetical protein Tco_0453999 [Tanacetum coccineum]